MLSGCLSGLTMKSDGFRWILFDKLIVFRTAVHRGQEISPGQDDFSASVLFWPNLLSPKKRRQEPRCSS